MDAENIELARTTSSRRPYNLRFCTKRQHQENINKRAQALPLPVPDEERYKVPADAQHTILSEYCSLVRADRRSKKSVPFKRRTAKIAFAKNNTKNKCTSNKVLPIVRGGLSLWSCIRCAHAHTARHAKNEKVLQIVWHFNGK